MAVKTVYRQGRTEIDGRAFQDYSVRKVFAYTDLAAGVIRFPVDKGRHLLGIRLHVTKGFAGATSGKIGDGADDDGYLMAAQLTQTFMRTDNFVISSENQAVLTQDGTPGFAATLTPNAFAAGGKFYVAAGFVIVTIAGTLTDGAAAIEFVYKGYEAPTADMIANY